VLFPSAQFPEELPVIEFVPCTFLKVIFGEKKQREAIRQEKGKEDAGL
jgi:hypothetical protein